MRALIPLLLFALSFVTTGCHIDKPSPDDTEQYAQNLPREYQGHFRWGGDEASSDVDLIWERFDVDGPKVTAFGFVHYVESDGKQSMVAARAIFFPQSEDIEIWEADPSTPTFESNGSHRGKISDDLRTIDATWIGFNSSRTGYLHLSAK